MFCTRFAVPLHSKLLITYYINITDMAYKRISAVEAASMIKNGENIALSGFTPSGAAKATTKELAKIALALRL